MPKAKSTKPKGNLTKRVKKLEQAQSLLGKPEFKAIYTDLAAQDCYAAGAGLLTLLNGVATGNGISSRDGRKIALKSVQAKLLITQNVNQTNASVLRAILFIDRSPDGTAPTITQVLDTTHGSRNEAFRNLDYRDRFVILKDKSIVFYAHPPYDSAKTEGNYKVWNFIKYKKLKLNTIFDASDTGTIADINAGALYLYLYSTAATYPALADICACVRFIDV